MARKMSQCPSSETPRCHNEIEERKMQNRQEPGAQRYSSNSRLSWFKKAASYAHLYLMFEETKKKKKVDYEALNSALMRIPRMDVAAARNLIDIGIRDVFQLEGRAPEILFDEAKKQNSEIPDDRIRYFRMAVYYAESPEPDAAKLHPDAWQ